MLTPPDPAEAADYGNPLEVLWQQGGRGMLTTRAERMGQSRRAVASGYGGSPSSAYGAYLGRGERDGERPAGRTRRGSIPCKYYNQQGGCASGRHCKFMHGTPAGGGAFGDGLGGEGGPKNRGVLCRFYARGYCRSGRKCPYSHSAGGADVDFNYHRRKSEFRAGGGADFGADMAALYGDLSGVELEEMRAALERQRLLDGGYLEDGEEGGEGSERQRLSSAGEDEWMIEGVTPDMDSSDPSERQATPLRLRQHPPSLLSRGSSNSLSDLPNGAYARPRRNGPPRRTSLAELVADAVAEGRLTRHGSTGTLAQLAQQQHHLQHHHQPQTFSSPSSPLYAASTRLSRAATMGMHTPSSLKHSSSATDLDENTIKSMAIFAMEGSSTPSTEVKTPLLQASTSSSRLQHYLNSAAASPRSTTTGPFSPPSLGTSPSAIGTLLDRCPNGPPQDILGSSFNSSNGLLLPPPLHSSGSNGSLLLNSPHASPLLRAALGGAHLSTLASGAYHRGSFSSLASFKLEEDDEKGQDGSSPGDEGHEDGQGSTKEEGSGEEGGGSDEGHKDREGRGKPEEDEDDDLEFGGLMDGQQLMDGQDDEDDEMFDAQHSDEAFMRSGNLHLPFDHAYRASLAGAYGGAQSQSTWSNGRHNGNVGPQYHTQPPAFDDQGYFYGAAGTFGNGNGGEMGGSNNGPRNYAGSPNQRFRPRREFQDQPRWAEVVGGGRQFQDGYQPRNRHETRGAKMCRFYLQGNCIHGSRCRNSHDVALPNLDEGADPPRTAEDCRMLDEEETRRSVGVECIICSEEIRGRFGIMTNCDHTFCLSCIRTWRQQNTEGQDTSNVRCCPVCKQTSHFVVPHFRHVTDPVRKDNLVRNYKQSMAKKPCKYFEYGREECPFGSSCFYAHLNPDGSRAEPPVIRTRMGEEGVVSVVQEVRLSDFLEAHRR